MPQGVGYGPNNPGFDPNLFQNIGFGGGSGGGGFFGGSSGGGGFFGGAGGFLGGPAGLAIGTGIDIIGGLFAGESEEEKLAKERRKRESSEFEFRKGERVASAAERKRDRGSLQGTLGKDVFDPFAAAQFSLSATRGRRAQESELISDLSGGQLFAPDVQGALSEKLLPGLLEGIRSDYITNKVGISQRDAQTRLALLNSAMSRFAGAQRQFQT